MKTTTMPTATEAMKRIETTALDSSGEDRFVRTMEIGKHVRQGDVYMIRVEEGHPKGAQTQDRQLAPGTTQGSRHVASNGVTLYAPLTKNDPLQGPVVVAPERWVLTHPQHSDVSFPSGTYRTVFPRDFEKEEIARVCD